MLRLVSAVIVLALTAATASAAEIKVISANGMREVIAETKAAFEKASGHTLNVTVVETGTIRKRVLDGEAFDVIMVPSNASEIFVKEGKQAPGAVPVIRVNFGLAVRESGPKPDVSNADALKKTFLDAKTVLITDPSTGGISGVHLMEVLGKLGIADTMKPKLKLFSGGGFHAERVVKGEADLAVHMRSAAPKARRSSTIRRNSSESSCSWRASARRHRTPRWRRATSISSRQGRKPRRRSRRTA